MSLLRQGKAQVLTIYLGESDQWHGTPLYVAIVQALRDEGCAGATVIRAAAGFGAGARLHESGGWRWSSDAPVIVQVVDQPERLRRLLPRLQDMLSGGLMTLHDIDVLKYTHARRRGLPTRLPVQQVMETAVTTVQAHTPAATIVNLLLAASFRALPVVDARGKLQGIISTGDLINAGVLPMRRGLVRTALEMEETTGVAMGTPLQQAQNSELTASDIMNRAVRTVRPDQRVSEAVQLMLDADLRSLPVIAADGMLVGMLTRADLLQLIVTSPLMSPHASSGTQPLHHANISGLAPVQQQPIAEYLNPDVTTVSEHTSLAEIIDALVMSSNKRVVVVDNRRRVRGIISDVDILASVQDETRPGLLAMLTGWARGKPNRAPTGLLQNPPHGKARDAADVMNRDVVTVEESTSIQETVERMMTTHRKILPVVNSRGELLGVVGRSDLLRVLLEG